MQQKKLVLAGLAGVVAGALVACGGGSSAPASGGQQAASSVALSGTAASGLAIAGGTVNISCQGATGSATTQSNGSYSVTVSGGTLPCALSVTAGGQTYRSVVAGSGSSATANITPLTEMLVGALLQKDPTALDKGAPATTVTADALKAAQTVVINYLQANDIDVSALSGTDFVSTPLVAATTTPGTGDAQDQLLDQLKAANVNPTSVATALQAAPTGCAFAKSGKYTLINYQGQVSSATVDFKTNTIVLGSAAPVSFSASSTYPCEYSAGTTTVDFASSGLAIYKDTTDKVIGIALPTQSFDTSLYGETYNLSGYFADNSGPFALANNDLSPNAQIATMAISTNGHATICADTTTTLCSDGSDSFSATVNSDGSVDLLGAGATTSTDKVYSYVAPNGKKLLVLANASTQSFLIGAKLEAIDPAKIEPNAVWFQVQGYAGYQGGSGNNAWTGATIASGTSATTAITATQGTVTQHFDDGVTADRADTMLWNTTTGSDTWNGMRHRNAITGVSARTGLSAVGMGFATNGSVNGGTAAAPTKPNVPGFTMSVKRIAQ